MIPGTRFRRKGVVTPDHIDRNVRSRQSGIALLTTVVLFSSLLVVSCGNLNELPTAPGGRPPDPNATFTRVQNEIFTPNCALSGCHDSTGQQAGQILEPGRAYAMIVNHPSTEMPALMRIAPGDPANSYMYRKITGAGITGERMPFGKPPLPDDKILLLRDWISRGAPND
jgi:hypothetical protein